MKESSPPSFQTFGAATAVTENFRRELFHPRRPLCPAKRRFAFSRGVMPGLAAEFGYFRLARNELFRNDDGGGLLPFGLWRLRGRGLPRDGQKRMPPQSDGTRGFWFRGDCFTRSRVTARGVGRCRGGGALIPKPHAAASGTPHETGTTNIFGCERSYFRSALIRSDFRPAPNRSASELYHIFCVKYIFENTRISPCSPPFTKRNNYRS